ncbi:hypothetical protein PA25_37540 [Pseudoalteromonas sp. A25]|uniref:nuclear transport factor 2 family protein n=1 Tax=Pseudoalteromonas sp. A25 TaxID=116092 RepID=UPI0012612959|nr:nuclear transport factor 2 family protein [Pseudoalteromonas sp. A25]BBN83769.1 hypothetical protein PA25_37540 [Pseudoalteromonas sp. A25]
MTHRQSEQSDLAVVISLVEKYFYGLHHGDTKLLSNLFHADVCLKAPNSRRNLQQWLADVSNRDTPAQLGHAFDYAILAIEIVKDQAMVKVQCPLFNFHYVDFLGLLKEQGNWLIVNKMYTDISA